MGKEYNIILMSLWAIYIGDKTLQAWTNGIDFHWNGNLGHEKVHELGILWIPFKSHASYIATWVDWSLLILFPTFFKNIIHYNS